MSVRFSRGSAAGLGFFTIAAQVALIREFLILFGGSEMAFGTFFAAWFLWVAVGATLVRRLPWLLRALQGRLPWWLGLQPLAGWLGIWAIPLIRIGAAVPSYEPLPPGMLVLAALLATGPVCLTTGLLFPALCETSGFGSRAGASIGYALEGLGAVAGGVLAFLVLRMGLGGVSLMVLAGLPLAAIGTVGALGVRPRVDRGLVRGLLPFLAWVAMAATSLGSLHPQVRLRAALPPAQWVRDLETPYQALTEARMPGQIVLLANGEVMASFPSGPSEEGTAAVLASLPPERRRALVLGGDGMLLAIRLTRYFEEVRCVLRDGTQRDLFREAWHASGEPSDPIERVIFAIDDERAFVQRLAGSAPEGEAARPDLLVVAAGEPATIQANRLYTVEFLEEVRRAISPGGVVAVPIRSGENALGTEALRYGQSVWQTLAAVFPSLGVIPGDRAILIASDRPVPIDAVEIARRYRSFAPSPPPVPPEEVLSRLPPDRVALATALYDRTDEDLVNRDERPLASLLHLLARLRETDSAMVGALRRASRSEPWLLAGILGLLGWVILRERIRRDAAPEGYAASILIGTAGGTSIAAHALLLAAYQARIGAIYGEVALPTTASMAGIALGSLWAHRRVGPLDGPSVRRKALGFAMIVAAGLAMAPTLLETLGASRWGFGLAFLVVGLFTGWAWPLAAGLSPGDRVAARLESADHWGAMMLSFGAGVLGLAVFGASATFRALGGLMLAAGALLFLDGRLSREGPRERGLLWRSLSRPAFPWRWAPAAGTFLALGALLLWHASKRPDPGLSARLDLEEIRRIEPFSSAVFRERPFPHHRLEGLETSPGTAVVASSQAVAPEVRGFGGPLNLALSVGEDGRIRGAVLVFHRETPSYVRGLPDLLRALVGRDARQALASPDLLRLDAMTGATVTREAVLAALDRTRAAIATEVLGLPAEGARPLAPWWRPLGDPKVLFVFGSLLAAVVVHLRGGPWTRLALLAISAVVGGFLFNLQLSASWIALLAQGRWPSWVANGALAVLSAGSVTLSVLLGPIYCAHLCPFGAIQEFVSRLSRRLGLIGRPPERISTVARSLKYGVLVLVILSLFSQRPGGALAFDPLATAFSGRWEGPGASLVLLSLAGSLLAFRFWCRVFCPVGALLSLGNRVADWLGLGPRRVFAACDLDVRGLHDLECLRCNRCVPTRRLATPPMGEGVS